MLFMLISLEPEGKHRDHLSQNYLNLYRSLIFEFEEF